jgi:hypothetical protein
MTKNLFRRRSCGLFPPIRSLLSLSICLISFFATAPVMAQSPDKIVKQALKAVGGEKAVRRVNSRRAKGVIARLSDGAKGSYQTSMTKPDLYWLSVEIGGFEASEGFNGKSGWRRDSRSGLRTLTGIDANHFRAEASFLNNLWLNYQKDKSKLAYAGREQINGQPAHVIVLTNNRNVKIKMWFAASSGLPLKEELPVGEGVKTLEFADHRPVNGLMEPHQIKLTDGGEQFDITLEQIIHNQPPDRALFDFPKLTNEPLPDIDGLLRQVTENQAALDQLMEKYTYNSTMVKREFDKNGSLKEKESETYEITFYRGSRIRRLIAKNDKPLSVDDQAKEDKKLEKRIKEIEKRELEIEKAKEKREREAVAEGKAPNEDNHDHVEDDRRITISDLLRASKLINPRRERYRQRDVIVFDFEPNPSYKPRKDFEKIMQKFSGAMWIDANDRQVARLEARLVDSLKLGGGVLASIKPGGGFVMEQDRINEEVWLPTHSEFNLSARVFLLAGLSFNATVKYGAYKRFNVDAEKEKLKDPIRAEGAVKP